MSISLVLQYDCLRGMWAFPDAEAPTFPTLRAPAAFQSFLWIRGRAQESSTGKPVVPFQREREGVWRLNGSFFLDFLLG